MTAADSLTHAYDWSQIILAGCLVAGSIAATLAVIGRLLWRHIKHELGLIRKEVTPNGGNTTAAGDTVQRTEEKIDEVRSLLVEHLTNHPGAKKNVEVPESTVPTRKDVEANGSS